jgi:hypothetical protein
VLSYVSSVSPTKLLIQSFVLEGIESLPFSGNQLKDVDRRYRIINASRQIPEIT